jgi:glycosyltransferase involved in cell wall biosynthesis
LYIDEDELTYGGSANGSSYKLGLVNITEGEFVTGEIERKHGVKCHNVGIGVDPRVFRPLPYIRDRQRILTALRTTSAGPAGLKGWDIALKAIREIANRLPGASLVTFGMEPVATLFEWIPHIHIDSPSDRKLRELYSQSGLYLSCSRHEGFGLPMLEAMACKCPVVCTDSHGNREFCRDGQTAMVAPSEDFIGVADRAVQVMEDDGLARRLSDSGYAESTRYRWSSVLDKLEALFTKGTL